MQCLEDRIAGQQRTLLLMNQIQLTFTCSNSTVETVEKDVDFEQLNFSSGRSIVFRELGERGQGEVADKTTSSSKI